MLPRIRRTPLDSSFFETIHGGASSKNLKLLFKRTEKTPGRLGVVVSKEAAKRAVDRHRLKRQVVALFDPEDMLGLDVCVIAKKGATSLSFAALKEEVYALFGEAKRKK
ncbi:MAG: ribonuclease P protein component [Patescibacteria group bacterium]